MPLARLGLPREANPAFDASPRLIVDAGANIGMATLYFAQTFPDARIVAIEPEASNFAALRVNCEGLPNVTLKHAALWPVRAALQLADPRAANWMFSVRPASDAGGVLPAITIPDILAESRADHIDRSSSTSKAPSGNCFRKPARNGCRACG